MDREEEAFVLGSSTDLTSTDPPTQPPQGVQNGTYEDDGPSSGEDVVEGEEGESPEEGDKPLTKEQQRAAKMKALKKKMQDSRFANRRDVAQEANRRQVTAQEIIRLERMKRKAEALGEKAEAEKTGENLERKRNWEYSIDDNEKWERKLKRKKAREDPGMTTWDDVSRRAYKKNIDRFKPDFKAYNEQRSAAMGSSEGSGSSSNALIQTAGVGSGSLTAAESLYRDANTFAYADHKPSDDAIDRVVQHLNLSIDGKAKRSRVKKEEEGTITYINEKNKRFNQKLDRFFNPYTTEIRENFERGTAL